MLKSHLPIRERDQELPAEHFAAWCEPLWELTDDFSADPFRFRRGFVEGISIGHQLLEEHGNELFATAPTRTLRMGDLDGFNDLHNCKRLQRVTTLDLAVSSLDSGRGSPACSGRSILPI